MEKSRVSGGTSRCERQTPPERAAPQHESGEADEHVQSPFERVMQRWYRQRRSQAAMEGRHKQAAEADYSYSAAKRQPRHDEDKSQGEHSTPHFLRTG